MTSTRPAARPTPITQPAPEPALLAPLPPNEPALRLEAPPRPTPPPRRWGLFAGGMTLLVMGYGADLGLSYGLGVDRAALSLIPVIGPLTQLGSSYRVTAPSSTGNPTVDAQANARIDQVNHAAQTAAYVVLSFDFALQLAGAVMAVFGGLPNRSLGERAPPGRVALGGGPGRALSITF